jgi:ribosomal RNA-processing protein 9
LETLFGHQDGVTAVDCWTKEKPVSASMDRTWRLWKVVEESHLVFRGDKGSLDAIQLMTEDSFVTGGQDGALSLWKETQKKPVRTAHRAHGGAEGPAGVANWISSLASVKMSNLVASGANDGYVRLWSASSEHRELAQMAAIKVDGFVNAMAMSPRLLVAGCGREPRLGRWWNLTGNKNKVHIIRFRSDLSLEGGAVAASDDDDDDDEEEEGVGSSGSSDEESSGDGDGGGDNNDDDE